MALASTPVGASGLLPVSYHPLQTPHTLPSIKPSLTRNLNYDEIQQIRIEIGSDKKFSKLEEKLGFFLNQPDNNFNFNILSKDGSSALDVAIDTNQPNLIMWLLEHGINTIIGRPNKIGRIQRMPAPGMYDRDDYRRDIIQSIIQYSIPNAIKESNLQAANPNNTYKQQSLWRRLFGLGGKHRKTHHRKRRTLRKKHTKTRRHHRK